MTDALKAMVEAIVAEFERQVEENRGQGWEAALTGAPNGECRLEGRFELEKVARAGLRAPGLIETLTQARPTGWSDAGTYHHLSAMIDAILGEKP